MKISMKIQLSIANIFLLLFLLLHPIDIFADECAPNIFGCGQYVTVGGELRCQLPSCYVQYSSGFLLCSDGIQCCFGPNAATQCTTIALTPTPTPVCGAAAQCGNYEVVGMVGQKCQVVGCPDLPSSTIPGLPGFTICSQDNTKCCLNVGVGGPQLCSVYTASPTPIAPPLTPTPGDFSPLAPPSNETFDAVNPLLIGGGDDIDDQEESQYANQLSTPGGIISRALTFIFPLAGLLLFALLVWGGFEMLAGSPTKKSMESGKNRITAALAGFFLLFAAYWIWQIVEVIFGVAIL